jgi:hypothetical protein
MKKRLISAVIAAVVLMFLLAACDEPQEVKIVGYAQSETVEKVTATQTINRAYITVTWDAITNGSSYNVYVQQEGKKSMNYIGNGQNNSIYGGVDGTSIPNTDLDKWSYNISNSLTYIGKSLRFGVAANDSNPNHAISDIVWSEYISVALP